MRWLAAIVLSPMLVGCTPEPAKVCKNVATVYEKASDDDGSAKQIEKARDACEKALTKAKEQDAAEYKTVATCAMAATDVKAAVKCDRKKFGDWDVPSPDKVCGKLFDLLAKGLKDKGDDEGKKSKSSDEMMEKMKEKCVKDAAKDKKKDPDEYKRQATCVMAAKSLDDAMKCEKSTKKSADDDKDSKKKKGDDDDD